MRLIVTAAVCLIALAGASPVLAKGCIRGAVAGGVAGHYVGKGHALLGAAGGCAAMHHHYARQAAQQRAAARAQAHPQVAR